MCATLLRLLVLLAASGLWVKSVLVHGTTLPTTGIFYGAPVPAAQLATFHRVVVEAENNDDRRRLRTHGARVFSCISLGVTEAWRESTRNLTKTLFIEASYGWGGGRRTAARRLVRNANAYCAHSWVVG
jgi:hypothetical protein